MKTLFNFMMAAALIFFFDTGESRVDTGTGLSALAREVGLR